MTAAAGETGTAPQRPIAVIALLLYNHANTLPEALDALRLQERVDFAVLLADDGSQDATPQICADAAARDARFVVLADGTRRGYIGNARHALAEARRRWPDAPYFAWGSDHDLYHPRWLASLVAALDATPEATLAWPLCYRIDAGGAVLPRVVHRFETSGERDPLRRFRRTLQANLTGETLAGNMIYGLFRRRAFDGGPGLPSVLLPDRVAVLEAALAGPCVQVGEPLWYRRYEGVGSPERQRRASFFSGAPWYLALPVWLTHAGHFLAVWGMRGRGRAVGVGRGTGLASGLAFLADYPRFHTLHRLRLRLPQARRRIDYGLVKPIRMRWHRALKRLRGMAGGLARRMGLSRRRRA